MLTEIELRQMRYFLAVAEERNFTRAAKRCHVAQPSLSKQIHQIENTLGAKLFERLPREVRITEAGAVFQREAARALEHSHRAVSLVRALGREKTRALRVGLSILCDLPRIQALVATARTSAQRYATEFISGYSQELRLRLLRGELDLAVVDLPIRGPEISVVLICTEPLIAWLPEKHALAARPMVRFFDLKPEQFVLLLESIDPGAVLVRNTMQQAGIEASSIHSVPSLIELLDHVTLRKSVGLTRRSTGRVHRDGLISRPLHSPVQLETAIAWRTDNRNPAMCSFRDALIAFSRRVATVPAA
ncbi:MAG: LysR family transcriptional regulator [Silvibacterium sp.]